MKFEHFKSTSGPSLAKKIQAWVETNRIKSIENVSYSVIVADLKYGVNREHHALVQYLP